MKTRLFVAVAALAACAPETETPAAPQRVVEPALVRLDEPGEQGLTPAAFEAAAPALATLAASTATQFVATRTQAGLRSVYHVAYPGNATGFAFERRQTAAGVEIEFLEEGNRGFDPLLAAAERNYATASALTPSERDDAFPAWASSLAALFDNKDAGDAVWLPAWCAQGAVAETGMAGANVRVPFDLTWPAGAGGVNVTDATAAAFAPTLGRLLGAPERDTVRAGVLAAGTLAWEDEAPLPVPRGAASRAVLILYRGLPFPVWSEARNNGKHAGWLAAVRNRDLLQVRHAVVHGPADATAGEVEWLTGAIPAHAGYLDGKLALRDRVSTAGELVAGDWRVYGATTGLGPAGTGGSDRARLESAAADPARLVVVLLDDPARAFREGGDAMAALVESGRHVAAFVAALESDGRLGETAVAFGATHGLARCTGAPAARPAFDAGVRLAPGLR